MKRQQVASSSIREVGYDSHSEILEIEFLQGGVYQYFNVPQHIYDGIMSAQSKGTFFHQYIKDLFDCKKT